MELRLPQYLVREGLSGWSLSEKEGGLVSLTDDVHDIGLVEGRGGRVVISTGLGMKEGNTYFITAILTGAVVLALYISFLDTSPLVVAMFSPSNSLFKGCPTRRQVLETGGENAGVVS